MKKIWNLLIVTAFVGGIVGCNSKTDETGSNGESVIDSTEVKTEVKLEEKSEGIEQNPVGFPENYVATMEYDSLPPDYVKVEGATAFTYKFSSIPKLGYHNICLDVSIGEEGTKAAELIVNEYKAGGVGAVQKFNLLPLTHGVIVSLTKSGADTILNIEASGSTFRYYQQITINPSDRVLGKGDIDLKLIAYHSYDDAAGRKTDRINNVCIVGMDDARDAGYGQPGNPPGDLKYGWFKTVGNVGPSIFQVRYVPGGTYGFIRFNSAYSGRSGSSWYDNSFAKPQIDWGCQ